VNASLSKTPSRRCCLLWLEKAMRLARPSGAASFRSRSVQSHVAEVTPEVPLQLEEYVAAFLLVGLLLTALCRLLCAARSAGWAGKLRRRSGAGTTVRKARPSLEDELRSVREREANLTAALDRVRSRASALQEQLGMLAGEATTVVPPECGARSPPDGSHHQLAQQTAYPCSSAVNPRAHDAHETTPVPVPPRCVCKGDTAPGCSTRGVVDHTEHLHEEQGSPFMEQSWAPVLGVAIPRAGPQTGPSLIARRPRHIDGVPPSLCLACFDCPCACVPRRQG
jgi:hypothetical protein